MSDKWGTDLFVFEVDGKPSGGAAGWMYQVNGVSPATTADKCTVKSGDEVIWYYSESMTQTPEESPKAFFYRVQTGNTPVGSGASAETTESSTGPALGTDGVSYPLSLPPGSDLQLSDGRMYLTVNVPIATAAGDDISFSGNTMIITRDDVILNLRFVDFTDKNGSIAGEIADVTVETAPVIVTCESGATPGVSLTISLMAVPMDADIDVIATPFSALSAVPSDVLGAANAALSADGLAVSTAGWQMNVDKRGLENGVDVGDVFVHITTDPACIAKAGGLSTLRLIHIMDDGTAEVLALRSGGTTAEEETILEAGPVAGLSSFLFVSVTDELASTESKAAASESNEANTTPEPTTSGTPLTAVCAAVAGLLGVTGIYRNKKR